MLLPNGLEALEKGMSHARRRDIINANFNRCLHWAQGAGNIRVEQYPGGTVTRYGDTVHDEVVGGEEGGGGVIAPVTGECTDTFVNSVGLMVDPSDSDCLVLFDVTFRRRIFIEDGQLQCTLLSAFAQFKWDRKMARCPGSYSSSSSSSSSSGGSLDRWRPCEAVNSSLDIFLPPEIFSAAPSTFTNPLVQLDGAGLCYEYVESGQAGTAATFTSLDYFDGCVTADCEAVVPCGFTSTDAYPSGLKISGYFNGFFGTLQADFGAGCADCTSSNSHLTLWDSTFGQYDSGSKGYIIPGGTYYMSGGANDLEIQGAAVKFVNPGGGAPCYFETVIGSFDCSSSSSITYRKYFGADWLGTYTLHATNPVSLGTCSPDIPLTIEIVAA